MQAAPTWIDERMAEAWRCEDRARHYGAGRWSVYLEECRTAFVVLATNSSHSSFGGDDSSYRALEVAEAIERWGTTCAGLDGCPEFIDALERDMQRAEAKGTRLEIIRAQYLLDAMRARVAIAHAEDAKSFTGYVQRKPTDDTAAATLVIPWDAAYDC